MLFSVVYMGGATIGAGGHIPPPCKGGGQRGSKYIVDILYECNKKYILHVYSIIVIVTQPKQLDNSICLDLSISPPGEVSY